jgi:hypothetical protein
MRILPPILVVALAFLMVGDTTMATCLAACLLAVVAVYLRWLGGAAGRSVLLALVVGASAGAAPTLLHLTSCCTVGCTQLCVGIAVASGAGAGAVLGSRAPALAPALLVAGLAASMGCAAGGVAGLFGALAALIATAPVVGLLRQPGHDNAH